MAISELPLPKNLRAPTPVLIAPGRNPQHSLSLGRSSIKVPLPLASSSSSASNSVPNSNLPLESKISITTAPALPQIFTPFPKHLHEADLAYLAARGAFILPSEKLQVLLLKSYMSFVHPNFPILELEEFLEVVNVGVTGSKSGNKKGIEGGNEASTKQQVPLLLFQAVMFASMEYVGMKALREAGFKTREAAQRVFFARVRVSGSSI